jgi:threonine dehydrogenase-like Zn-dependent dehydrogenase
MAVMVEPTACGVHAAASVVEDHVVVLGAGTIGLCVIAALRDKAVVVAAAKHPIQRDLARDRGAHAVHAPDEIEGVVRRRTHSLKIGEQLTGGADCVVDCIGSSDSLQQALRIVAPGGTVYVVGMPATVSLDLTGLWHREVKVQGVYAYTHQEFQHAFDVVRERDLGRLVSATYPLDRWKDAIRHAAEAGRRGAVKVAFDLRNEKERERL